MEKDEKKPLLAVSAERSAEHNETGTSKHADEGPDPLKLPLGKRKNYYFLSNVLWYEYLLFLVGIAAAVFQGVMPLAFYFYFGKLVDYQEDPELAEKIRETSYIFFGIAVGGGLSAWINTGLLTFLGERISSRIRQELFSAITMQEVAYFDQTKTGTAEPHCAFL